jgi:aminotransferase
MMIRCVFLAAVFGVVSLKGEEKVEGEKKVAVVPGEAFGPGGEGFVRCSYATALDRIEVAAERIGRFVKKLGERRLVAAR